MKIKMPYDTAIKLLQDRIAALSTWGLNAKAWKETTVHNVNEIFDDYTKAQSIQNIKFDTPFSEKSTDVFSKGVDTARAILVGYIETLSRQKSLSVQQEKSFQELYIVNEKNNTILKNTIQTLTQTITLQKEQIQTEQSRADLLSTEVDRLNENTVQFDNVSLLKLLRSFNWNQWAGLLSTAVVIATIGFWIGIFYEKNSNNDVRDFRGQTEQTPEKLLKTSNDEIPSPQDTTPSLKKERDSVSLKENLQP